MVGIDFSKSYDISFDFEIFTNPKNYHFDYKPIHNDSYDVSFPKIYIKHKVARHKETILSPDGKKKVLEALRALRKGEVKEFYDIDDLIKELNS